jgi:polygalacturonase
VLLFSRTPKDYLPVVFTRWEGVECMNYSAFIYAFEQENIAVTGQGILDGAGRQYPLVALEGQEPVWIPEGTSGTVGSTQGHV